jgi:hypothetical protein
LKVSLIHMKSNLTAAGEGVSQAATPEAEAPYHSIGII